MSYCRCGDDSDVYVYACMSGGYDVLFSRSCSHKGDMHVGTATECRDFLVAVSTQVKVPQSAIDRLNEEIAELEAGK